MAVITGTAGPDLLTGGLDADSISGLAGDDTLDGGGGLDSLDGGDGNDLFRVSVVQADATAVTAIQGGLGVDTVDASAITSALTFTSDTLGGVAFSNFEAFGVETFVGGSARNTFDFSQHPDGATAHGYTAYGGPSADYFTGGTGNDTFYGGDGDDRFLNVSANGLGGDYAYGGAGADIFIVSAKPSGALVTGLVAGGDGVDLLRTNPGVFANLGAGTATGGEAVYRLFGIENVQATVYSGGGHEFATGDDNANVLTAANATNPDTLAGSAPGGVTFDGAGGDDTLVGGAGSDTLVGGAGIDTADYGQAAGGVSVSLALQDSPQNTGSAGLDQLSAIENLSGSGFADLLTGSAGANALGGGDGADTLIGGGGADVLTGGAGADVFAYTAASDSTAAAFDVITDFQTGIDKIDLSAVAPGAVNIVAAGPGVEFIFVPTAQGQLQIGVEGVLTGDDVSLPLGMGVTYVGGAGGDSLIGGSNLDVLYGGAGADTLVGGPHGDVLFGGAGADVFLYAAATDATNASPDSIFGFEGGIDRIDMSALDLLDINIVLSGDSSFIFAPTAAGPVVQIDVAGHVTAADITTDSPNLGINVIGSENADSVLGTGAFDALNGGGGDDTLAGGGRGDILTGGAGSDTFLYLTSTDSNTDSYDLITDFQTGSDKIDLAFAGVSGVNIIQSGGASYVFAYTAPGHLLISAEGAVNGSDLEGVTAGIGMTGGSEASHTLVGADYGDTITGGALSDVIDGGGGDDIIYGGGGGDRLTGGDGADTFRYLALADSTQAAPDSVTDFASGVDHIDVSALHTSGATLNYLFANGDAYVFIDQGGGGAHEAVIVLEHTTSLQMSDFVW